MKNHRRNHEIDEVDRKIIHLLQSDGRMSNTAIARILEVTETTVRKRTNRLLRDGFISIVAVPSPEAVGLNVSAIIGLSVDLNSLDGVCDTLKAHPKVRYVGMATGRYDVIVEAFFPDQSAVLDFMKDLAAVPGVADVETSLVLKIVKFSFEWEIV